MLTYTDQIPQGRTIKNILRTAVAYGYADGDALGLRHVVAMLQTELREIDEAVDEETLTRAERDKRVDIANSLAELRRLALDEN